MKNKFIFLINLSMMIAPAFATEAPINNESISSLIAVSQTGRFVIKYLSPLSINKSESLELTNFIAYQDVNTGNSIIIGAVLGDADLSAICKHPSFLKDEKISDVSIINDSDIQYFNTRQYKGCIIDFDKDKSAIIVSRPEPFVNQNGDKVKHVGIIVSRETSASMKDNITFQITAKDYFLNLMQLTQAFSPFSKNINWNDIKSQGLEFIGNSTETCRGLSAAAKFLIPALKQQDLHSFLTLKSLDTPACPAPPIPEDETMKKWLSVPESTRNTIVKYSSDFHGYELKDRIAYLYIPGIEAYDPDTIKMNIKKGRDALNKANIDESCGLIVDLRFNIGGSLESMLLTLGGIIPSGKIFSLGKDAPLFMSEDGNTLFINSSHDIYGKYDGAEPAKNRNEPVAILTNWMTASSGELTRLALRDNAVQAKVFGTNTSSTASVNATFYLLDGNTLNLMVDRIYNNRQQKVSLSLPAEKVVEDNLQTVFDPYADMTLTAAQEWIVLVLRCQTRT